MSANSKIEWTDHTWNPWEGCQKVGPGCDNCYAEARNARFAHGVAVNWGPGAPRRRTSTKNWNLPARWNAQHDAFFATHGRRQAVFCSSLADVFDNAVDDAWRVDMAAVILKTSNLDWLLLTKRIGNAAGMLKTMFPDGVPPNVRIGATIVNQEEAARDIPKLLRLGLPNFLSMEPLLGNVDLSAVWVANDILRNMVPALPKLDWVIVGGETGTNARPMHPDWPTQLREQCEGAGVPFLFKQWGDWAPHKPVPGGDEGGDLRRGHVMYLQGTPREPDGRFIRGDAAVARVGKKVAGRMLEGRTHDGFPVGSRGVAVQDQAA